MVHSNISVEEWPVEPVPPTLKLTFPGHDDNDTFRPQRLNSGSRSTDAESEYLRRCDHGRFLYIEDHQDSRLIGWQIRLSAIRVSELYVGWKVRCFDINLEMHIGNGMYKEV